MRYVYVIFFNSIRCEIATGRLRTAWGDNRYRGVTRYDTTSHSLGGWGRDDEGGKGKSLTLCIISSDCYYKRGPFLEGIVQETAIWTERALYSIELRRSLIMDRLMKFIPRPSPSVCRWLFGSLAFYATCEVIIYGVRRWKDYTFYRYTASANWTYLMYCALSERDRKRLYRMLATDVNKRIENKNLWNFLIGDRCVLLAVHDGILPMPDGKLDTARRFMDDIFDHPDGRAAKAEVDDIRLALLCVRGYDGEQFVRSDRSELNGLDAEGTDEDVRFEQRRPRQTSV
ncbi:gp38.1 [Caviid betaherpesvirus 2]|uniref:Gp38.1 n=1 Tax=Guinea pig cytomegalovirus (strain 22122) TaxID=103920 RepID=B7TPV8_GPCMV|nr:gp38.1 [Caviid betaherpesvirus 2]AGE11516.1 gp38.1 [Caviid betaherpesvirus 2]AIL83904.1 gp38.1 [BAC cloning vector GPN13BACdenovo_preserved(MM)]BAJ78506.1 gp38.1 [Caviid betaherpesvirus 2]